MTGRKWSRVASTALAVVACAGEESSSTAVIAEDSAGIEIVENGPLPDRTAFRLGEPVYVIGGAPGDRIWERVESGTLLTGGRVAVADAGSREVVVLGPSGALEAVLGGPGEGPGEFGSLRSVLHLGRDTIVAEDPRIGRATLFHECRIVGSYRLDVSVFTPMTAIGTDGRGGLILTSTSYWPYIDEPWVAGVLARYDLSSARTDTLVRFDYRTRGIRDRTPNVLGPRGWAAASPRDLVSTRTDRTQVERFDPDGRLVQLIRWTEERQPFHGSIWTDFEEYQRSWRTASPQLEAALAHWRSAAEGPLPYSTGIRTDDSSNVWVGEYSADPRYPPRYRVFSKAGMFRGWVVIPNRVEVLDIGEGFLLGVHRDDLGVAAVALYRLQD